MVTRRWVTMRLTGHMVTQRRVTMPPGYPAQKVILQHYRRFACSPVLSFPFPVPWPARPSCLAGSPFRLLR